LLGGRGSGPGGGYADAVSAAQLDRYFHLDAADRELVDARRGAQNRLGFALQLGTVRFLGRFLADPTDMPAPVVVYVAAQLGIDDPDVLKGYARRQSTQWEHAEQIRRAYGYRGFSDPVVQADLTGWLAARGHTATGPGQCAVRPGHRPPHRGQGAAARPQSAGASRRHRPGVRGAAVARRACHADRRAAATAARGPADRR